MQEKTVKIEILNEFAHHFHGRASVCLIDLHIWNKTTGTAENLKFYSKWAVSICCLPLHIKIDCLFVKLVTYV